MSRLTDILLRARDSLADPDGDRWSDNRLIRLLDEAQKDICRRAHLLRTRVLVPLEYNNAEYKLPTNLLLLDRVLYEGNILSFKSHLELDESLGSWEDTVGNPTTVIYDKQNRQQLKLYPIPQKLDIDNFTIVDSLPDNTPESPTNFGITTYIDGYELSSDFGILADTSYYIQKDFGLTQSFGDVKNNLIVYYLRKPLDISIVTDIIEIDDSFDAALKYFIVGRALRDDMDVQNRTVGNEELGFYDRELREAIRDDRLDFTRNNTQYNTQYRSGI